MMKIHPGSYKNTSTPFLPEVLSLPKVAGQAFQWSFVKIVSDNLYTGQAIWSTDKFETKR